MDSESKLPSPPDAFVAPLLELRDYYAPIVEKYEKLYTQAISNLHHVEALLSGWGYTNEVTEPVAFSLETLPFEDDTSTPEPSDNLVDSDEINDLEVETSSEEFPDIEMLPVNSAAVVKPPLELLELTNSVPETSASQEDDDSPESLSTEQDTPEESQEKSLLWSEIPMLPEYQSLNRTEAILKILQKHAGGVCHISLIMRSLYGELEPDIFKVVKGRVQSTLTRGRETGKWWLVPGKPGYYTLDLKLLNTNRSSSSKQSKNNKPSPAAQTNSLPMVEEFSGKVLIDAISCLLQKNPGKTFTIAEVINGLCGEVDTQQFNQIKSKVLKELSRGHRTGRFSRVPGEIGLYTWDSKLLSKANAS
ncbi:hypothetical protein [Halotia branconii]|uniref:Uncharacterized protein n=1 Tax=Halotia branconii CENA392 TaxID=1539056 RepID=A0AAJ6NYD6_9CYAN|nr:hypothetical protein [Halotia branconii]WGV29023.1 hypothetical protein QI031_31175 [Halotia branconii CENA392]